MTRALAGVLFVAIFGSSSAANALPRFAARVGADCRLCHVNPSGGGLRNRYGSQVFQQLQLPFLGTAEATDDELDFSGRLNDWLTLGGDVRAAYIYDRPEASPIPGAEPEATSTFFLMQADLYVAARLGSQLAVVLDLGAYSGFEAYLLWQAAPDPGPLDLYAKVGHFTPTFGLRDPNHDLYTRGGIGLGASDRDTGVELTGILEPFSLSIAILNGTFAEAAFDQNGTEQRTFEKAIATRLGARFALGWLKVQLGASAYLNDNVDTSNPLFGGAIASVRTEAGVGELRLGAHALLGLGRFSYQGELVYVRDGFEDGPPNHLTGYASAQELGIVVIRGVEVIGSFEFKEPNLELAGDTTMRFGAAVELFPLPFLEIRTMARRSRSDLKSAEVTDVLVLAHGAF